MVAPRKSKKIFCTVVVVDGADDSIMRINNQRLDASTSTSRFNNRPSELLPWADPYISALVTKLQKEVRDERNHGGVNRRGAATLAELEPPTPATDADWDWRDEPRWTFQEEA